MRSKLISMLSIVFIVQKSKRIHDRPLFSKWKQELLFELNEIYDRTKDNYIANTLSILNTGFKGSMVQWMNSLLMS